MTTLLAKKGVNPPLVEVAFEIQFQPKQERPVEVVMPGILLASMGNRFFQAIDMPGKNIPTEAIKANKEMHHLARAVVSGATERIYMAYASICIVDSGPYSAWEKFKHNILSITNLLSKHQVMDKITRTSLRYRNIFPETSDTLLDAFNVQIQAGEKLTTNDQVYIRFERKQDAFVKIVTIANKASYAEAKKGTLLDIDVVRDHVGEAEGQNLEESVDNLHTCLKSTFIESVKPALLSDYFNKVE